VPAVPSARPPVRLVVAALVAAAVVVLPAALGGSGGPLVDGALGSSCAAAAGTVHVGLVIDFGDADPAGAARSSTRQCVSIADRQTGADALVAGGHRLGWSSSGLLCSIDDYPATGSTECGRTTAHGYRYWSYWHGGAAWTYSSVGPAGFRPADGSVEGWHFVDGGGNPSDPPPAGSPSSPCPAGPPATTGPTTAPPTTAPNGRGAGPATPTPPTDGSGGGVPTTAAADLAPGGASSPDASGASAATDAPGAATTASGGAAEGALGGSAPASSRSGSSRVPVGVILLAVAVVALGGSALVRSRARSER
jgi:hypothetical protein